MRADARHAGLALVAALLVALGSGCARESGPPPIRMGDPCARCGMDIGSKRFACEREVDGTYRAYDAIECLLRDRVETRGGAIYLPDYDQQALHSADSLWLVHGSFETPMGGGLAAFLDRHAADELAGATRGVVGRLADFADADAGAR